MGFALTGLLGSLALHLPRWQFGLSELLLMLPLAALLLWQWQQCRTQQAILTSLCRERDFSATLLNGIPGMVYLIDEQMRIRHWNHQVQALSGYGASEIAGMHPLAFFRDQDREAVGIAIQTAFEQGSGTIEADLLTRDGTAIPCSFNACSLTLDGQSYLIGMGFDISQQRQAQQVAEQAHTRLEQVLAINPATIYTFHLAPYEVTFVSDAIRTLTGHTPQECLTDPHFWHDHLHPQDRQAAVDCQNQLLEQGWLEHEYRFRCRDGSYRWIHDKLVLIRDEQGQPLEAVGAWLDITGCKETALALRESEKRFQVALQGSPVTVFNLDTDLHFTWLVNPILNAEADLIGRSYRELFEHPEEADVVDDLARQVLNTHQRVRAGISIHYQGQQHFYDLTAEPLRDEDGRIVGMTCTACELTDLKRAEAALQESELRFRTLAEHAPVGIFETDTIGSVHYINRYAMELLDRSAEQLLGEQWMEAVHPDDRERVTQGWLRAALEGRDYSTQYRFLRPQGDAVWILGHATPLRDERGQVIGYIGTLTDITALKLAQEQSTLWGRAVEAAYNGIIITDATRPGHPILTVNPAYERITGFCASEVLGRSARFLYHPEEDQPGLRELRQALREGREAHVVVRNYRKDGSPFWNELFVAPVYGETGQVTHFVGVQNDITERKQQEAQLLYQAHYDALTGLPNRDLLADRLSQALAWARRSSEQVAVLFTDLDRFKMINDSLGHRAGDALLQIVAGRLKGCVRENDTVARLGGDEFVIVLQGLAGGLQVANVAEKVLAVLQEPVVLEGQDLFINASIGIALFPDDGTDAATLLKHADAALHQAKEAGRGTLHFHAQGTQEHALRRLNLSTDLRQALDQGQLVLHYQPQVSLRNGQVVGVEALLRWEHPRLGMISPNEFIPLAEETGLIVPIGEWIIRTACAQARTWHDAGLGLPAVAVNLSTRQFIQRNLPERISHILHETGLPPQYLEVEITESLLMRDVKGAVETLKALKAMGLTLAIDDFGTGYSSLNYLKSFPLDRLKIDQSFVRDITSNPNDAAITQAIIDLARNLRLKVIAEGVETAAQLAFLRAKGCDEIQGWYFSSALTGERLTGLLRQNRRLRLPDLDKPVAARHTLLLVDDDQALLDLMRHMLEREGYRVLTATSAEDAFEVLARHRVGVAIVDHVLPGLSGIAFLRRIRELYPQVVRVLLSGHGERQVLVEAINQGAIYRFLEKPVTAGQMRDLLHDAFLLSYASGQSLCKEGVGRSEECVH